jgi:hypothetical protein
VETILGERGTEEITAELLEAGAIVGRDPDVGVQVEAVEVGVAWAASGEMPEVRLVAKAADAGAGAGAEGDATLDGGIDETRKEGRGLGEGIGGHAAFVRLEPVAPEQPPDPGADRGEDVGHVVVARRRGRVKGEPSWPRLGEDARDTRWQPGDVSVVDLGRQCENG